METNISVAISSFNSFSLSVVIAILVIIVAYFALKDRMLPPGPIGLPYFGYWPFMNDMNCHLKLDALKKKHGDVISFTSTGRLFINLGSIKAVREAFVTKSEFFGDRISGFNIMNYIVKDGVAGINGEHWKVIRKFFSIVLKERGVNALKTSAATPLYDSLISTINELKAKNGEPINIIKLLFKKCTTFLRLTLFGEVGLTDEQIEKFVEFYSVEMQSMTPMNMLLYGTLAKYFILPFTPNYSQAMESHQKMITFLHDIINQHKATYDAEHPRDIIDEYFKERDKRRSKGDPTAEYFSDETLVGSLIQFIGDGVSAVASFTNIVMKHVLECPEEQDKLYKEIIEVIGTERQPTLEDKSKMSYFNAYIMEAVRTSDFFNIFPSQECVKETTLGGYRIPKGAILMPNFYSCHHDPEMYEEPEIFNPTRFIQQQGKRRPELPILFGVGKRSCLGEGFVMMQIFLLLATLIQNFELSLPGGPREISIVEFFTDNLLILAKPRDKN